ncbi:MAG: multidrug ABC transporter ATP-binding protein [Planctomycetaceae bacterium]|nr:multidrug ABC transporter ATP-binding protein [Planctomycetaceae bacterium]
MTQSDDQVLVKTVKLTKRFGDFVALNALDLELRRKQILGFIGPNGAGKTTTIRILVGLSRPTSGEAFVADCDCTQDSKRLKRLIGYLPDTFGSYDNMRVREYLDFFGAAFKMPRKRRVARIEEVMELTDSGWMRDRYVETLSHGMKQKVGIARTLLHDPPVLILDEPANGLDPKARIEMRDLLLRLADMGKTLIVTSHILSELSRICDVVSIITHGEQRAFGTLDEINRLVSGPRLIELTLADGTEIEAATRLINEMFGPNAEVQASAQEAQVRFTAEADDAKLSGLLTSAVKQGLRVAQLHEVPVDLEDAFLQVTGGVAADDSPSRKAN